MSEGNGTGIKVTDRRLFLADGTRNGIHEAEQTITPKDKANGNGGMSRAMALDTFRNAVARMGAGTASIPEATEYVMQRLSLDFWLLLTLYRNTQVFQVSLETQQKYRLWSGNQVPNISELR